MGMMRVKLFSLALLGAFMVMPIDQAPKPNGDGQIELAYSYGQRRPFNWYYPYSYKYYYPRPHLRHSSSSCYWVYVNGSFVYMCQ